MSKKKVFAVAAVLVGIGAVAAVSAPGQRGGWGHGQHGWHQGDGMGLGMGPGMGQGMGQGMGDGQGMRRGMFGPREMTKADFDTRTRERFARLDKNSDGVIDASEIEAGFVEGQNRMMQRGGRGPMGGTPGEQMLQRFDTNKDGKVTREEFLERVKKRFAEADLNNDGKITDDDLPPMMRGRNALANLGRDGGQQDGFRGRGRQGGPMMGFLRGVEVKDGAISLDAVLANAAKEFDRFDKNKDSAVDKTDFDALRKEMTDYRVKRFIHSFGADKDGKVTRDQFFAKSGERFAEMDRNNDGKISREDMGGRPGFGERMRERFGRGGRGGPDDGMGGPVGPGPGSNPGMPKQ